VTARLWDLNLCDGDGRALRYLGCATDRGSARHERTRLAGELGVPLSEVRITRAVPGRAAA
jgi:hypothetical protein